MPYTYTYPHEPLRPPRLLDSHRRWVVLAWAVTAAAGIAAATAGKPAARAGQLYGAVVLPGR